MAMWKMRSCTRCGGDVFIDRDLDGWYEQCLQCSHRHELKDLEQPQLERSQKEPVLAGEAEKKGGH